MRRASLPARRQVALSLPSHSPDSHCGLRPACFTRAWSAPEAASTSPSSPSLCGLLGRPGPAAIQPCLCGRLLPPSSSRWNLPAMSESLNDHRLSHSLRRAPPPACRPAAPSLPCYRPDRQAQFTARVLHPRVACPRSGILRARLTRSIASKEAPLSSSSAAVALWPPAAAFISAVLPICVATHPQRPQPPPRGMRRAPPPARRTPA